MVQFFPLLCCNLSVFAFSDPVQSQIHDPDPFQLLYLISQIPAHSADLSVQSLRQNDTEAVFSDLFHLARSGSGIQNRDPTPAHLLDKFFCDRFIHRHQIFFFVIITGTHDLIDDISVVCHQKQSFGIFIQPSNRKNACRILKHILHGHIVPASVRRADYALWFVKRQQNHFLPSAASFSVDGDLHLVRYLPAIFCTHAVHKYFSFFDQAVCFTP